MHNIFGQCGVAHDALNYAQQARALFYIKTLQRLPLATGAGMQSSFVIKRCLVRGQIDQP